MKYIAVQGCQFSYTPTGTASVSISGASTKNTAEGKGMLHEGAQFTISGYTNAAGFAQGAQVQFTISSTSQHLKIDSQKPLLEGDMSATLTLNGTQGGQSATATVTVKISSAGQSKVSGL